MKIINNILLAFLLSFTIIYAHGESYYDIAKFNIGKYNPIRKDYVIVVDYRENIFQERLYVVDMKSKEIILSSVVSHGYKSGLLYATDFSNINGSNKSSKGVYTTGNIKYGKFGYSMYIKGLDKGINSNAYNRSIIFHSNKLMKTIWSQGCFATPEDVNKKIIDITKNGCLIVVIV